MWCIKKECSEVTFGNVPMKVFRPISRAYYHLYCHNFQLSWYAHLSIYQTCFCGDIVRVEPGKASLFQVVFLLLTFRILFRYLQILGSSVLGFHLKCDKSLNFSYKLKLPSDNDWDTGKSFLYCSLSLILSCIPFEILNSPKELSSWPGEIEASVEDT